MAMSDNQLEACVTLALETQTIVTARQQDAAWERLRQQAQQQVMLVPYAAAPRPTCTPEHWQTRLLRRIVVFLLDDSSYHRAAANRQQIPISGFFGGSLVVHYQTMRPIGFNAY
jgi:hypothetical protein